MVNPTKAFSFKPYDESFLENFKNLILNEKIFKLQTILKEDVLPQTR